MYFWPHDPLHLRVCSALWHDCINQSCLNPLLGEGGVFEIVCYWNVFECLQLVPAVTELLISELLWLNYSGADKPVYLYVNSIGSQTSDGQVTLLIPYLILSHSEKLILACLCYIVSSASAVDQYTSSSAIRQSLARLSSKCMPSLLDNISFNCVGYLEYGIRLLFTLQVWSMQCMTLKQQWEGRHVGRSFRRNCRKCM